jgi:hypothetical protein
MLEMLRVEIDLRTYKLTRVLSEKQTCKSDRVFNLYCYIEKVGCTYTVDFMEVYESFSREFVTSFIYVQGTAKSKTKNTNLQLAYRKSTVQFYYRLL